MMYSRLLTTVPRLNPALYLEDLVTLIVGLEQNLGIHNPWT